MKKIISFMVFALLVANTVVAADQFTLKGKVDGVVGDSAVLSYWSLSNNQWNRISYNSIIKNGQFQFKGTLKEPVRANLKIGEKEIILYIEPTNMELYIPKEDSNKFLLKGSKTQDEEELLARKKQELISLVGQNHKKDQENYEQLQGKSEKDSDYKKLLDERELISLQRDSITNLMVKIDVEFIKSNPNSYSTVISKPIDIYLSTGYLSVDSARVLFNSLAEKVRLCTSGIQVDNYIKTKENIVVGKMASDFVTPDTIGKMIKLSDFRGKSYVLLDFWASWCVPCLKGVPQVKELYSKYRDKGLEVLGISVDNSKAEWLSAIKKHNLGLWHNVLSRQNLEKYSQGYINPEDIAEKYPTDGIPKYILIDKTGKIIAKWEGYSEENEKNQDKVLKEVFGE